MACTLQTTSKQVEIHNRLLRPGVSFLYAKRHSEMNATSAIIAARDLVRPPLIIILFLTRQEFLGVLIGLVTSIYTCGSLSGRARSTLTTV